MRGPCVPCLFLSSLHICLEALVSSRCNVVPVPRQAAHGCILTASEVQHLDIITSWAEDVL